LSVRHPLPSDPALDQAFLRWRGATLCRWRSELGYDAEDFLGSLYLRVRRQAATGFAHRSDAETRAWIERVASFALLEFRRDLARQLGMARVGLEEGDGATCGPGEDAGEALDPERAALLLSAASLTRTQRIVLVGRVSGVSAEVLALMLGVETETVERNVRRATERVRKARETA
jgi:DNA-directed RNA polymerase specialized sigma24 family protein